MVTVLSIILLVISVSKCKEQGVTPYELVNIEKLENVAAFNDAQHRGYKWYDDTSGGSEGSDSDLKSAETDTSSISSSETMTSQTSSSEEASSAETKERKRAKQTYRTCTPCPHEMMKKYKNIGIKWICGGYQRARRTFKSECMMRYRNCEDGTMFVKLYDHRCKNDSYHGRHWFYVYKV